VHIAYGERRLSRVWLDLSRAHVSASSVWSPMSLYLRPKSGTHLVRACEVRCPESCRCGSSDITQHGVRVSRAGRAIGSARDAFAGVLNTLGVPSIATVRAPRCRCVVGTAHRSSARSTTARPVRRVTQARSDHGVARGCTGRTDATVPAGRTRPAGGPPDSCARHHDVAQSSRHVDRPVRGPRWRPAAGPRRCQLVALGRIADASASRPPMRIFVPSASTHSAAEARCRMGR